MLSYLFSSSLLSVCLSKAPLAYNNDAEDFKPPPKKPRPPRKDEMQERTLEIHE